mgnify:CR=1 FL=1|tara:strand:+ start:101 stop:316 length:216 start_codon:yes stop_codon:yes gene_type:complete
MLSDKTIKLRGISGHGKNRIREHGELWTITKHHLDWIPTPPNRMVESVATGHQRWVNLEGIDPDFIIVSEG